MKQFIIIDTMVTHSIVPGGVPGGWKLLPAHPHWVKTDPPSSLTSLSFPAARKLVKGWSPLPADFAKASPVASPLGKNCSPLIPVGWELLPAPCRHLSRIPDGFRFSRGYWDRGFSERFMAKCIFGLKVFQIFNNFISLVLKRPFSAEIFRIWDFWFETILELKPLSPQLSYFVGFCNPTFLWTTFL